jgi:hypothetical protein
MVSRIQQRLHERVSPEFGTSRPKSIRFRMRQIATSMFPALLSGRKDHVFGVNERMAPGWLGTRKFILERPSHSLVGVTKEKMTWLT